MKLKMILARAANGVIGIDNRIPWHLPEDLAHFRRTTLGAPVIMGRRTWDSLPPRFRPLPGRINVVVTRQPQWQADGARIAHSLEQALAICAGYEVAWVMGGAELYRLAEPLADEAVITEIDQDFPGDAFAPDLGPQWRELARERSVSSEGLRYSFVTYRRSA